MKAIETKWKGWRFRSRTEARWAVFLESLGVAFDYEPEGLALPSGPYLPDFRLRFYAAFQTKGGEWETYPRPIWLEVKGQEPTRDERVKCSELASASGEHVLLAVGAPDARPQVYLFRGLSGHVDMDLFLQRHDGAGYFTAVGECVFLTFPDAEPFPLDATSPDDVSGRDIMPPNNCESLGWREPTEAYVPNGDPKITSHLRRAYDAARSARFEFGETDQRWEP